MDFSNRSGPLAPPPQPFPSTTSPAISMTATQHKLKTANATPAAETPAAESRYSPDQLLERTRLKSALRARMKPSIPRVLSKGLPHHLYPCTPPLVHNTCIFCTYTISPDRAYLIEILSYLQFDLFKLSACATLRGCKYRQRPL